MHLGRVRPERQQVERFGGQASAIPRQSAAGRRWRGQGRQGTVGATRMMAAALIGRPPRFPASRPRSPPAWPGPSTSTSARCSHAPASPATGKAGCRSGSPGPRDSTCSRAISTHAPPTSPSSSGTAASGARGTACITTRNSLVNSPNGGSPATAITPRRQRQPGDAVVQQLAADLPGKSCDPFACAARPTTWNTDAFAKVCSVMCSSPANVAPAPPRPKAKAATPLCSIVENEKNRTTSRRRQMAERPQQHRGQAERHDRAAGCDRAGIVVHHPAQPQDDEKRHVQQRTAQDGVDRGRALACASGIQACSGTRAAFVP